MKTQRSFKFCKIVFLTLILLFLITGLGICATGVPGAKFLTLPMSSRAIGLGNAYTAEMDRIDCVFVNDAGIADLKSTEVAFHNTFWMFDMNYTSLAFITKLPHGTIGGSLILFMPGQIIAYDGWGYEKEELNMYDLSFKASYGLRLHRFFTAGIGIKFIYRDLADITENAVDFDAGVIFRKTLFKLGMFKVNKNMENNFKAGIAIQNILGKIGRDRLPTQLRLGVGYKIIPALSLLTDYVYKFYDDDQFNTGLEYSYHDLYFIRAGYIFGNGNYVFTSGMGLKFKIKSSLCSVDYSYSPLAFDYNVHSLNFALRFVSFDIQYNEKEEMKQLYMKGGAYYLQGEYEKAVVEWIKILEIDPDYPGVKEKIEKIEKILKLKKGRIEEEVSKKDRKELEDRKKQKVENEIDREMEEDIKVFEHKNKDKKGGKSK